MTDRRRNILKTVLLCLSQFQWLVGIVVGLAGLYLWVMFRRSSLFFSSSPYMLLPVYFTLATGGLLLISGFLGSWVFTRDSSCLQGLFVYLLVAVFCLGSTATALAVYQSINLDTEVHPLSGVFQNYTGSSQDPNSRAVDILQETMECCGVQNYTDWLDTSWFIHTGGYALPLSCCNSTFTNCTGTVFLTDQFYQTACHQKICTVFRFILLDIIVGIFASVFLEQVILLVIMVQLMREPPLQHYQLLRD